MKKNCVILKWNPAISSYHFIDFKFYNILIHFYIIPIACNTIPEITPIT